MASSTYLRPDLLSSSLLKSIFAVKSMVAVGDSTIQVSVSLFARACYHYHDVVVVVFAIVV